jgi:hypothetical protein
MPDSPLYFHLFLAVVALFGYIYYRVSRDLTQTSLAEMGAIGKILVFGIVFAYWIAGIASWHLLALGSVDFVYAILFVDFLTARTAGVQTQEHAKRHDQQRVPGFAVRQGTPPSSRSVKEITVNITSYFSRELFKGKTVFITGGGSGINLGIARNFAALGANIAICGRTQAKLDGAAAELRALGAQVCPAAADVRDFAALEAAFARSRQELGPVDVLVAAPRRQFCGARQLSPGGFKTIIDIDLLGSFNVSRAAFEQLETRGTIIYISSGMALCHTLSGARSSQGWNRHDDEEPGAGMGALRYPHNGIARPHRGRRMNRLASQRNWRH